MRLSTSEKEVIIRLVDRSKLGVKKTFRELGLHKSTFYNTYRAYLKIGKYGLSAKRVTRQQWKTIPEAQWQLVVEVALEHLVFALKELVAKLTDEQRLLSLKAVCTAS